jgi:predicted Rossmann-fold nucleotide-binding protein
MRGVDTLNTFNHEIITLDYFDRTKVMLETTDAHIVFNGSIGTLSELGMTWISSWIHYPNNKPIILFGQFWHEYIGVIKRNMLLHKAEEDMMKICTDPNEVVQYLKDYNGKIGQLV